MRAIEKFVERNAIYNDLWKTDSRRQHAHQLRHKALRANQVEPDEAAEDSFVDAINYAVFGLRKINGE
jgi:hypothetical protein